MSDVWNTLEEYSQAWTALDRQGLADSIWADFVTLRFSRTGDPRALDYLYPYLNHADRRTRIEAIEIAARVFHGRGGRALDHLDYFTKNPDPFLRDRAVIIAGAALVGSDVKSVLEGLSPYLQHHNQFIQSLAMRALGRACSGQAADAVLQEILRLRDLNEVTMEDLRLAIAYVFTGHPTEEVYDLVVQDPEDEDGYPMGVLMCNADEQWQERAYLEVFRPLLHEDGTRHKYAHFARRDGIHSYSGASFGRGIEPLRRMLHLCGDRCTGNAMLSDAQHCFVGTDTESHRGALIELALNKTIPVQRVAAICLGRLVLGEEDTESMEVLFQLCGARSRAVQAAALEGLGMAARSTGDEDLRQLCLDHATTEETASAAIRCLGMVYLGSGDEQVGADIRDLAERLRSRPVRGKKHCKPLAACYRATGLLYLGTGSLDPVEFLLDVLAVPRSSRWSEYGDAAAKALAMIEFPASCQGWEFVDPWPHPVPDSDWRPLRCGRCSRAPIRN